MIGAFANQKHKALQRLAQSQQQSAVAQMMNQQAYKGQLGGGVGSLQNAMGHANNLHQANAYAILGQGALSTTSGTITTISATNYYTTSTSTSTSTTGYTNTAIANPYYDAVVARQPRVQDGQAIVIELPDGSKLDVKADGSYELIDKDAKITYRANRLRDFNTYLNASDKLEEFIRFCGEHRIDQQDMMDMPVKLFIAWLVQEAAKADQEPVSPDVSLLPDLRARRSPRCGGCGRFLRRQLVKQKLEYCAPVCFDRHYQRQLAA